MRERAAREVAKGLELDGVVVDTADKRVLVRWAASRALDVLPHDLVQPTERVLAHARHKNVAGGLNGGVQ